jgi:hypothetical protein
MLFVTIFINILIILTFLSLFSKEFGLYRHRASLFRNDKEHHSFLSFYKINIIFSIL